MDSQGLPAPPDALLLVISTRAPTAASFRCSARRNASFFSFGFHPSVWWSQHPCHTSIWLYPRAKPHQYGVKTRLVKCVVSSPSCLGSAGTEAKDHPCQFSSLRALQGSDEGPGREGESPQAVSQRSTSDSPPGQQGGGASISYPQPAPLARFLSPARAVPGILALRLCPTTSCSTTKSVQQYGNALLFHSVPPLCLGDSFCWGQTI